MKTSMANNTEYDQKLTNIGELFLSQLEKYNDPYGRWDQEKK